MLKFIIGGYASGKKEYLLDCGYKEKDFSCELNGKPVLYKLNNWFYTNTDSQDKLIEYIDSFKGTLVIAADETGCGLLPSSAEGRDYNERFGSLCQAVASRADTVERIYCGLPQTIKNRGININLIRHAPTQSNLRKAYIGITDEPAILDRSIDTSQYGSPELIFSSPLLRCVQTAEFLFPSKDLIIYDNFRECNFGDFEGKTYEDLKEKESYMDLIKGKSRSFPGGESYDEFSIRCMQSFYRAVSKAYCLNKHDISIVCHGGVIMAILSSLTGEDMYKYQVENLSGYRFIFNNETISELQRI